VIFAMLVSIASWVTPAHALTWAQSNCYVSYYDYSSITRADADFYAHAGTENEGYEWGGGCYLIDGRDNTPNAPDSGGEGRDCSSFVFTSWYLMPAYGQAGYRQWSYAMDIHGPYSTGDYFSPAASVPFVAYANKSYATTTLMDALVYHNYSLNTGHIALVHAESTSGTDYVYEAKSDAVGTVMALRDYRAQTAYKAITRKYT
jgi:hypothetical protein